MTARRIILAATLGLIATLATAEDGPPGLTVPRPLEPYAPSNEVCGKPSDLKRALVFARDNEREFMSGVDYGLSRAAADRGLEYRSVNADNDAGLMNDQIDALLADRVGAVVVAPVDPVGLAPHLQRMIWSGSYVGAVVPPPATTILNAPQYLTGKVLADAAVDHIARNFEGRANVVILTHDSLEFLAPRFTAIRDALQRLPGAVIVADISPETVDRQGGHDIMQRIMLAEPNIDVVLGADTVVLGALDAMREAGKARADQFFGGIDGEPDAVRELQDPGSPYKVTVSLASPVFAYALGQQAADYLEGRVVPQAMDVLPFLLTPLSLGQYRADTADPASVYSDPERRARYLRMYGGICYDTRDRYLNFPWSSE